MVHLCYTSLPLYNSVRIACVSCPSAYTHIKELHPDSDRHYLFEYDKRFQERFPEHFVYYDYSYPLNIDKKFKAYFDIVIVDPPYLSEECLEKTSETVQFLTKDKIVLCTGAVMEDCAKKLLGVIATNFTPQHKRKLGNEFKCYTNWNFDEFLKDISRESLSSS
ncbi:EEF1A lysine methyltransferase 1-like [Stegodyphus dumicola]|uniref:EEF1A lysine methyltransferase 1-like n=1 Tax=Stegodyphus dumicola TaxID=202533 RepID=UPI0015A8FF24|nr:EEF1A lysine methyltransferase 1-like [Stegodyphus dumicola]